MNTKEKIEGLMNRAFVTADERKMRRALQAARKRRIMNGDFKEAQEIRRQLSKASRHMSKYRKLHEQGYRAHLQYTEE